jgi:hypothetical protein
MGAF